MLDSPAWYNGLLYDVKWQCLYGENIIPLEAQYVLYGFEAADIYTVKGAQCFYGVKWQSLYCYMFTVFLNWPMFIHGDVGSYFQSIGPLGRCFL